MDPSPLPSSLFCWRIESGSANPTRIAHRFASPDVLAWGQERSLHAWGRITVAKIPINSMPIEGLEGSLPLFLGGGAGGGETVVEPGHRVLFKTTNRSLEAHFRQSLSLEKSNFGLLLLRRADSTPNALRVGKNAGGH